VEKLHLFGATIWSVPNDYPQIVTADGGVIGASGVTYDDQGKACRPETTFFPSMATILSSGSNPNCQLSQLTTQMRSGPFRMG
jgi:hypothetical protein